MKGRVVDFNELSIKSIEEFAKWIPDIVAHPCISESSTELLVNFPSVSDEFINGLPYFFVVFFLAVELVVLRHGLH